MSQLTELLNQNKDWSDGVSQEDPSFFQELSKGQSPRYLWIGCADSRVPAAQVCGLMPGEVFVHRNIANLVVSTDLNMLSVAQYAIDVLKVKDVVICGHYGCGGVAAAMSNTSYGIIDNWLKNIKNLYSAKAGELPEGGEERVNRLCELNVEAQVHNLCHTTIVQEAWKRGQDLNVHGLIYDLKSGQIKDLEICVSKASDLETTFSYS